MWKEATAFIIPFLTASINYVTIVTFPTLIQILIYTAFDKNRDSFGFSMGLELLKDGDRLQIRSQHSKLALIASFAFKFMPCVFQPCGRVALAPKRVDCLQNSNETMPKNKTWEGHRTEYSVFNSAQAYSCANISTCA